MSKDPSGFLAYCRAREEEELVRTLDAALYEAGFTVVPAPQPRMFGFQRSYGHPTHGALPCVGSATSSIRNRHGRPLSAWGFFPLYDEDLQRVTTAAYLDAIRSACVATDAVLGRAFHATGMDAISASEVAGEIDMLTWVQYFGPGLSESIGVARIQSAPFHSLECLPNGAHLARTSSDYWMPWPLDERRALLDHLGIVPRRLYYQNGPTSRTELRWC